MGTNPIDYEFEKYNIMTMENLKLSIARDFTVNPGVRYPEEDSYSGQEFREKFLRK